MKLLFKSEDELKPFLPAATTSFKLSSMQVFLMLVQNREIKEALGFAQLTELAVAYEAGPLTPAQQALLPVVQLPLASYGSALYLPHSGLQLTGSGAKQAGTEQMKPASPKDIAKLAGDLVDAGDQGIEALLEFLEENRADYPTWASSDACTVLHAQFLATAKEFDQYVFIDRSRKQFRALQPAVRDVERLSIVPLMGADLVQELRDQLKAGTVTNLNEVLLTYLRPTVASLAMRDDPSRQELGKTYLDELRLFLYDRADNYPLFKASSAYKPDIATQLQQDTDWGFYGAF